MQWDQFDDDFFDQSVTVQVDSPGTGSRAGTTHTYGSTPIAAYVEWQSGSAAYGTPADAAQGNKRYRVFTKTNPGAVTSDLIGWNGLTLRAIGNTTQQGPVYLTECEEGG